MCKGEGVSIVYFGNWQQDKKQDASQVATDIEIYRVIKGNAGQIVEVVDGSKNSNVTVAAKSRRKVIETE